ncbi:MAG: endonuclease V [Candidatus Heimdallarchaeaceae archaeon]
MAQRFFMIVKRPKFEYVSGLLFMREVPIFLRLVEQLENQPDLFLIDGHGIAHPLYAGSATVFGYFIKTPVIGVAKAPMNVFEFGSEEKREDFLITNLYVGKRLVGKKIAYKDKNWKPIYVSPGNNISISSSLDVVINLLDSKHKLPKPLLLAHLAANEYKENIYH